MYYAVQSSWAIAVGDVSTAFLHTPLPAGTSVYVRPPPSEHKDGVIWQLNKAVYGLRQAPRLFQEFLSKELEAVGW
eukprot:93330-Heterocapsa_arctica.AAC.1